MKFGTVLLALSFSTAFAAPPIDPVHPRTLLDANWRFYRGDVGPKPNTQQTSILNWRWKPSEKGIEEAGLVTPSTVTDSGPEWKDAKTGADVFQGKKGFVWMRAHLPAFSIANPTLHFESVDDNADVYLNGTFLVHHEGWDDSFDVPLAGKINPTAKDNVVTVLVENTNGPGGITGNCYLGALYMGSKAPAQEQFNDAAWRLVHLPHDYVIEGKFDEHEDNSHGSLPKPNAWYRKTFDVPASAKGKVVSLQFDGVYRNSSVWCNGHLLGVHPSGYTGFRYDISQFAHYGLPNVISVHVNPTHNEGWWYEGGGIYRHVWLDIAAPVSIAPDGVFVTSSFKEPVGNEQVESAVIQVQTDLKSEAKAPVAAQINAKVLTADGKIVASASTLVNLPDSHGAPISLTLQHPELWSLERPYLYHVLTQIEINEKVVDERTTAFGVRGIRFDADKGFFLNGKHVEIQGTCNHQDFAGLGIAVPDSLEFWRVKKLKAMGSNAWRMSHNPPTPSLLDACDQLGMLVMDENRHLGNSADTLEELSSMVLRDRNHPSVIMWSMCNEQPEAGGEKGGQIFKDMMATVKNLDSTRPVSSAMNSGWFGNGFTDVEDLMGVNYNYEVYDKFHAEHPKMPMFGSETASTVTTRGEYADDKARTVVSSYNMTDGSWAPAAERPFVAGTFVWTGFDYKGEPSPYNWPCINSNFGIMDMCGFPKDNYYYYQSWWKSVPVVHIMPHWTLPGMEGKDVKVVVFSNAPRVQLLVNGVSVGTKEMPRNGHLEWTVPYVPGSLIAKGLDNNDSIVAEDKVATAGDPVAVRLSSSRTALTGNGEDVEVVTAEIIDAHGQVCPNADNIVTFQVTGAGYIAGVGNGNPGDHDPDKARFRHAFHGKCIVIVGTGEKKGAIHLTASAAGLAFGAKDFVAR